MIELKNVSFRYDKTVEEYQIDTVSFHVKQGEWLSIVGHNGSGKSTVVRLIWKLSLVRFTLMENN